MEEQVVDIPLIEGITNGNDERLSDGVEILENCTLIDKTPRKRNGHDALVTDEVNSYTIGSGMSVSTLQDELILCSKKYLYSYSKALTKWVRKTGIAQRFSSAYKNALGARYSTASNDKAHYAASHVTSGDLTVLVEHDGSLDCTFWALEKNTNAFLALLTVSGSRGKAVIVGSTLGCLYNVNGSFQHRYYVPASNDFSGASGSLPTDGDVNEIFSVIPFGANGLAIAYYLSASNSVKIRTFDNTMTEIANVTVTEATVALNVAYAIDLTYDSANNQFLVGYSGALGGNTVFRSFTVIDDLSVGPTPYTVQTLTGIAEEPRRISLAVISDNMFYAYTSELTGGAQPGIRTFYNIVVVSTETPGSQKTLGLEFFMGSRALVHDGEVYVYGVQGPGQETKPRAATYYAQIRTGLMKCINLDTGLDFTCAKSLHNETHDIVNLSWLICPHFDIEVSSDQFKLPVIKRINYTENGGVSQYDTSMDFLLLDYGNDNLQAPFVYNKTLFMPGSIPMYYDGLRIAEYGFVHGPSFVSLVDGGAGAMGAGLYSYIVIAEHIDRAGVVHYSEPSAILTLNQAASRQVTVTYRTIKGNVIDGICRIHIYRSEADRADAFFRITSTAGIANDSSVFTATHTDNMADSVLLLQESYKFSGNVFAPAPPPPSNSFTTFIDRLVAVNAQIPNTISYSQKILHKLESAFSDFLRKSSEEFSYQNDDSLQVVASMDDKIIMFGTGVVVAISGDGPDRSGDNETFTDPVIISKECGTVNPRSVMETSLGIFFQSEDNGLFLIERTLNVKYIGDQIENFSAYNITGAVNVPKRGYIVFITDSNNAFVYDYISNKFSTFANYSGNGICLWEDNITHVKSDGTVHVENANHNDDGAFVPMKIGFNWIKLAGLQGFSRIKRMIVHGKYVSAHNLKVEFSYDGELYVFDSDTYVPMAADYNRVAAPTTAQLHAGANNGSYEPEFHLKKQKCRAIKVTIEDVETTAQGESLELTAVSFLVGLKKGRYKRQRDKKT